MKCLKEKGGSYMVDILIVVICIYVIFKVLEKHDK